MKLLFSPLTALILWLMSGGVVQAEELHLLKAWFIQAPYELSGLAKYGDEFLTVSDDKDHSAIYRFEPNDKQSEYKLKTFLDLRKLTGFPQVLERLQLSEQRRRGAGRFDLEGLSLCNGDIFVVNERALLVHRIRGTHIETLGLPWGAMQAELEEGGLNAGFEGIAIDCASQTLYLAKERQPRMIYAWNLNDLKFIEKFDIAPSARSGQRVIDFETGKGLTEIASDFSDLYFDRGYLYALERNTKEITKIDVRKKQPVARVSYFRTEWGLYDTPYPFGQAEGLFMDQDFIYLSIDNNHTHLSHEAKKKYGVKGKPAFVAKFARPKDF